MKFKDLSLGEGFRYDDKLFIKVNLPIPAALNIMDNKGKIIKFKEDIEVKKVILDINIAEYY